LEETVASKLGPSVAATYEKSTIEYTVPARAAKYRPDFQLSNGVYIETKGRFMTKDRQKHVLIQEQHPDVDLRFVFSRSRATLYKGSKTTYAQWCAKHGFQFADKAVPLEWIQEKPKRRK